VLFRGSAFSQNLNEERLSEHRSTCVLLRPSPSSSLDGTNVDREGEAASSSAAVDVFAEPASQTHPKTPTPAPRVLRLGGVDVSADLDGSNRDETPTPPRRPSPFAPPARGPSSSARDPSCLLVSSMISTGIPTLKTSGAGPHTPVISEQHVAGSQYGIRRRRGAADPRVAPCTITMRPKAAPAACNPGGHRNHPVWAPIPAVVRRRKGVGANAVVVESSCTHVLNRMGAWPQPMRQVVLGRGAEDPPPHPKGAVCPAQSPAQ
jgi:hypothetical protein